MVGEAIAGQRIDAKDVSGVVPVEELYRLRQELAKDTTSSYYDRWARWFFAESASRTISRSSNITIPEYHEIGGSRRIHWKVLRKPPVSVLPMPWPLAASLGVYSFPGKVRAHSTEDAEWFSRYATKLGPDDPEVQQIRQSVLEKIGKLTNNPATPAR